MTAATLVVAVACTPADPTSRTPDESWPASVVATTTARGVATTTSTAPTGDPTSTATSTTTSTTTSTGPVPTTAASAAAEVATLPTTRPWRVLVVGDSVAASLAGEDRRELVSLPAAIEADVLNVGSVACPIIFDGAWWFSDGSTLPDNPVCDGPERYDDELAAFVPDVVLAVFGWPGAGGGQRFSDGTIAEPCDARFDRAWEDGYRDLVERLAPRAIVVAATVAPIAMDARRPETRCLNDIVRRLPAVVLDLQDWLCPELDCSVRAALRPDGVHFADEPALRRTAQTGILTEVLRLVAGPPAAEP